MLEHAAVIAGEVVGVQEQRDAAAGLIADAGASGTVLMHMQENAFNPGSLGRIKTGLAARGLELCRNQGATSQSPRTLSC